jgi:pimeloyl-ACP methyl ester carboxylesterase
MDALGVSKAHLIGLSLGSMVAADVLALYPERVSSAVMASGIMYTEGDEAQPQINDPAIDPAAYRKQWMEQLMASCGPYASEIRDKLHQMVESWTVWQPRYETDRPLLGPYLVRLLRLTAPDIPTLTVIGMADSEGSRRSSEAFITLRPSTETVRLPDAGHFSCMETPETFNREVFHFLSRTGLKGYAAY